MKQTVFALAWAGILLTAAIAVAGDWITAPSYYTHDPQTGGRVRQYSPIGPFYIHPRADYQQSGYRHTRSSIRVGGSADDLHVVEEWGRPVRPYGEWQFPFRPYSVPYQLWGPPWYGYGWSLGPLADPQFPGSGRPYPGTAVPASPGYGGEIPGWPPGSQPSGLPASSFPGSAPQTPLAW
jgi:hypothetical protein